MKKVAFHTLGCKVNQVETEQIKEDFIKKGYNIVNFNEPADVYIVNTCTVTHISDRKSRAMIRRAARINPDALIVATGCLAQANPDQIAKIEGINLIVGANYKQDIARIIDEWETYNHHQVNILSGPISKDIKPATVLYSFHHERARAFVKIEDGCENFCSYCIVPYARGPVRSKLPENVLDELKQLVSLGYREIVFTGINTGLYGSDLSDWNLVNMLQYLLDNLSGNYRIRLSSIEPLQVSDALIELVADEKRICRHFHIPLQSGSEKILKQMNRKYTRSYYQMLIEKISKKIPEVAITTDVMVGFPGEEEQDFLDTFNLIDELPFFNLHVFKYSRRPGTRAADFNFQLPDEVKQKRSDMLLNLANDKRQGFMEILIGKQLNILVEKKLKNGMYSGVSDNYINVLIPSEKPLQGQLVDVIITDVTKEYAIGRLTNYQND